MTIIEQLDAVMENLRAMVELRNEGEEIAAGHYQREFQRFSADFLRANAAAIRAALEEHEWRPIETAPRDGSEILLFGDGQAIVGEWLSCASPYWLTGLPFSRSAKFTHWKPLPAAPSAGGGETK